MHLLTPFSGVFLLFSIVFMFIIHLFIVLLLHLSTSNLHFSTCICICLEELLLFLSFSFSYYRFILSFCLSGSCIILFLCLQHRSQKDTLSIAIIMFKHLHFFMFKLAFIESFTTHPWNNTIILTCCWFVLWSSSWLFSKCTKMSSQNIHIHRSFILQYFK